MPLNTGLHSNPCRLYRPLIIQEKVMRRTIPIVAPAPIGAVVHHVATLAQVRQPIAFLKERDGRLLVFVRTGEPSRSTTARETGRPPHERGHSSKRAIPRPF